MNLKLNRGKAFHLLKALEYYEKQLGLTDPMFYMKIELEQLIKDYDKKTNA